MSYIKMNENEQTTICNDQNKLYWYLHIAGEDDEDGNGKSKGYDVRSSEMTGEFINKIY